jgi:phosphoribosylamine--glycine ligase
MKILVIGGGGREHALAWKLAQSPGVEVFAAPGNPGIARIGTCVAGAPLEAAEAIAADLTVIGPEAHLVAGVVDQFRACGRAIVGPNQQAARLEGSKIFAKNFMIQRSIPTARFVTVDSPKDAMDALARFGFPVVLKADGLAAGKGVVIAHDRRQAEDALSTLTGRLVIEEFLKGEEVSFIALCDGKHVVPLAPTQDHKAIFDGDQGPNTGGMGAYCDSGILSPAQTQEVLDRVILPTVETTSFVGFLYAGLMMTADGFKVLEFNVRLGDPETQPLMHRLASDLAPLLLAASKCDLGSASLQWRPDPSICVVLASHGYPGPYEVGKPISGIDDAQALGTVVFHAGTREAGNGLETAGGRVLGVTASGPSLSAAIDQAYAGVRAIHFEGVHYRCDIGRKGLVRL